MEAPPPTPSPSPTPRSERLVTVALGALALGVFTALTVALFWKGLFTGGGTIVGAHGDPPLFIWYLQWLPFALGHHLNPLLTTYLHYPQGANLMWNTSIVFPALVLAPVTIAFGPITAYNVLCVMALAISAWCGYLAARRFTRSWWAAGAGGLLYGFSPYMVSQSLGHPFLIVAFYPALMVVFADEILVRQRCRSWLLGLLLGAATAAQLMTSEEILGMTVIMAVPALIALGVIHRVEIRRRLGYVLRVAGPALLSFLTLAGYPLYVQLLGPQRVRGPVWYLNYYVATLERFIVPTSVQLLGVGHRSLLGDSSVYIGLPLLLLTVAAIVWLWRRTVVVVAAVTLTCAVVFSLGGFLHLTDGHTTSVWLPWRVIDGIPALNNILPIRVMLFGYLALALLLAVFLDRVLLSPRTRWRVAGILATVVALLPLLPSLPFPSERWSVPPFFSGADVHRLSTTGSVLLTSSPGYQSSLWQAVSAMSFRSATGPVFTPGPGGWQWGTNLGALGTEIHQVGDDGRPVPAALTAAERSAYVAELQTLDVGSVVVGPEGDQAGVARLFTELLGSPGQSVGGVVVWYDVDPGALPDA
ncbi:MAG: hypothetical protein ABSE52_07715 [Candidatus Dormibacteria bacterium]